MDCFLDFRKVEILIDIFETWKILSFFSFFVKFWNFLTRFEIWIINFQNKIAQLCLPSGILIKTVTHRLTPCSKRRVTVFTTQLSLSLLQCSAANRLLKVGYKQPTTKNDGLQSAELSNVAETNRWRWVLVWAKPRFA